MELSLTPFGSHEPCSMLRCLCGHVISDLSLDSLGKPTQLA